MTLSSNHTLTLIVAFARRIQHLLTSPCYQRICHTIEAHVFSRLRILTSRQPMFITASHFSLKSRHTTAIAYATYPSPQLHSANLTPSLRRTDMLRQITNFRVTRNRCCALVGLSIPSAVATLHPPSCHDPSHSSSNLLVINTTMVAPSSGNLHSALKSSNMAKISSITYAPLAIVLKYMATSSILFGFGTATPLHNSGNSRRQSLQNFVPSAPFKQSLQLLSLTTMADVSRPLPPPSNQLAGVSP